MKEMFKKITNSIICSSILALIVGIIMIAFPKLTVETFGIIAAIYLIIHGCALIVLDIKYSSLYVPFDGLFSGILSIILGIVLLCFPDILPILFTFAIGIWIIISSINYIRMAVKINNTNLPWVWLLLLGILDLIIGLVMIFNPFEATVSLTLFAGIIIIAHSIINIVDMIIIKKDVNDISKIISEKVKEATKIEKTEK